MCYLLQFFFATQEYNHTLQNYSNCARLVTSYLFCNYAIMSAASHVFLELASERASAECVRILHACV